MAFSPGEIASIANGVRDFDRKEQPLFQTGQVRPLPAALMAKKKTFAASKGAITGAVKGLITTTMAGYTHNDTVGYVNPANIKRVSYPWRETHAGISVTLTELKIAGISVVDSARSESTSKHSDRDMTVLVDLLQDKFQDMNEGIERSMNGFFWGDGTADPLAPAGVQSIILTTPAVGTTGGIDRATNAWWRNRAQLAIGGAVDLPLLLKKERRQLTRFGGDPRLWLAGSDFIDALDKQLYDKGLYTQTGFVRGGKNDIGVEDVTFMSIPIVYDPTLDDLGFAKRLYMIDTKKLFPYVMEGEDMKDHTPARPATQYVMYRATTWTGNLFCNQLNCHGVYEIA